MSAENIDENINELVRYKLSLNDFDIKPPSPGKTGTAVPMIVAIEWICEKCMNAQVESFGPVRTYEVLKAKRDIVFTCMGTTKPCKQKYKWKIPYFVFKHLLDVVANDPRVMNIEMYIDSNATNRLRSKINA